MSDSLWLAGQEVGATVTLVSEDYCITPHLDYKLDNFTEKVPATAESVVLDWSNCPGQTSHVTCFQRFPPGLITANHPNVPQLQLFTFNKKEEVQKFILEHIQCVSRSRN